MSAESLDTAMDDRRTELGMLWEDVAAAAGVSYETLRAIRRGRMMRSLTRAKIEQALRWPRGHIQDLLTRPPEEQPPFELRDDTERQIWSETRLTAGQRTGAIKEWRQRIRQTGQ